MSKVTITPQNIQKYIDSGQIDPNKIRIDLNKVKTAGDNVHRWVSLQSAIDSGYDFNFDYEIKPIKKHKPKEVSQPEQEPNQEVELPELVVTATKENPSYNFRTLFEPITNRIEVQTKHLEATELAGSSLSTIGEFVDVNLPGVSKITSPSWWLGNIGQGYIENPFSYNKRNNGIFEFSPLRQYANEWYAPWINLGIDLGTGYSITRGVRGFNNYLHTPIELGSGAEMQRVYTYPFSKYVYKEGFAPAGRRLEVGRNMPLEQIGATSEGIPIFKQRKLNKAREVDFNQMKKILKRQNFFETKFPGDTETVFYNPYTDEVAFDLIGNYGESNGFSFFFDPPQIFSRPEYLSILKRGGKLIPKANNGMQVKIKLPDGRTTNKTHQVGSFLKLKGENFYRRVNSDGTLTKVGTGNNGTYNYNTPNIPGKVRNETAKSLKIKGKDPNTIDNIIGKVVFNLPKIGNYITPWGAFLKVSGLEEKINQQVQNALIRNTIGSGDYIAELDAKLEGNSDYYDGKMHDNSRYNRLTTPEWNNDRNIVNLYTQQDDWGFTPSTIGAGRYMNNQDYKGLPAYEGNFYGVKQIYVPNSAKGYFDQNLNREYLQDHDVLTKGMKSVEGLDDVQHYWMTPRKINNQYYIDFEDIWDIDRAGLNSQNYPFILNQRLPIIFTDDEEKLNITPELSNWFDVSSNWNK